MSGADSPLTMKDRLLLVSLLSTMPGRNGRSDLRAAGFDLDALLQELRSEELNVRQAAAAALGNWARHDPDSTVVKALKSALENSKDSSERLVAMRALGNWAGLDSFNIANDTLDEYPRSCWRQSERKAATQALSNWAKHDPDGDVRDKLISQIKQVSSVRYGDSEAVTIFAQALGHWAGHDPDDEALKQLMQCGAFEELANWRGDDLEDMVIKRLARELAARAIHLRQPIADVLGQWDHVVLLRMARGLPPHEARDADREGLGLFAAGFQLVTSLFQTATATAWSADSDDDFYRLSLASLLATMPGRNNLADLREAKFQLETLLAALGHHDARVRRVTAITLSAWAGHDPGNRVRNALIRQLGEGVNQVRVPIIATLGRWAGHDPGHAARDALIRRLGEEDTIVRDAAVHALGHWAGHDSDGRALAALIGQKAYAEIGHWAGHDPGNVARDALIGWAQGRDCEHRTAALRALRSWARHDTDGQVLQVMIGLLPDPKLPGLTQDVARAIGSWAKHDPEGRALQQLIGLLDDQEYVVRNAATQSLNKWPARKLLQASALKFRETQQLSLVAIALGGRSLDTLLDQPPDEVTPDTLVRITVKCEDPFGEYARRAFGCFAGNDPVGKALELVLVMTRVASNGVRRIAAETLSCWAEYDMDGRALRALISMLDDEDETVRQAAAAALKKWNRSVLLRAAQGRLNRDSSGPAGCEIPDWVQKHAKK